MKKVTKITNEPYGIVINYPIVEATELERFFELLETKKELSGLSGIIKVVSKPLSEPDPHGYKFIQKILILRPFNFLDFLDVIIDDQVWELPDEEIEDINYLTKVFLNMGLLVSIRLFNEIELYHEQTKFLYKTLLTIITMEPSKDSVLAPMAKYIRSNQGYITKNK